MANTVEVQTILDGKTALVVRVHLEGDGTGDETDTVIVDASSYTPAFTDFSIMGISSNLVGFSAELEFDATANVHAFTCPDYNQDQNFRNFGGIPNNAGAGKTGDLVITTTGLGAGDTGHIILELKKKGVSLTNG